MNIVVNKEENTAEYRILQPGETIVVNTISIFTQDESDQASLDRMIAEGTIVLDNLQHRPIKRAIIGRPATDIQGRTLISPVQEYAVLVKSAKPVARHSPQPRVDRVNADTRLVFIGGRWGSGKDTLAKAIVYDNPENDFTILRNKDFYRDENGKFVSSAFNLEEANRELCSVASRILLAGGNVIIVDYFVVPEDDIKACKGMIYQDQAFSDEAVASIELNSFVFMARGNFETKDGLSSKAKDAMVRRRNEKYMAQRAN